MPTLRQIIPAVSCCCCLVAAQPLPPTAALRSPVPPLPPPTGQVLRVDSVEDLYRALETVPKGGTILLADGHYRMPRYAAIRTDGVTLRGASGDPAKVILDGADSRHGELLGITGCADVTVADLTVQNIRWNGIKLNTDQGVHRVTIWNCIIRNIWQRGIKAVRVPAEDRETMRPRQCRIQHCLFINDRPKRFEDDPTDTADTFNGNYIGGIDVMFATEWTISDNVFIGIKGRTGEARGAIFLWHDTRDCVVERNLIVDCDAGICLGNAHKPAEIDVHCSGCTVRNNMLTRTPENGILADYTRDCTIVHNTVHDPDSRLGRLIRLVHDNEGLLLANNLLSGPNVRRDHLTGEVRETGNLQRVLTDAFVDPASGNLRLTARLPGIVGSFPSLPQAHLDIDGNERGDLATPGAHEP